MKAVLISIKPQWCEKIARGKKTLEVRKTRPKLEPPFKCYIYCTDGKPYLNWHNGVLYTEDKDVLGGRGYGLYKRLNMNVIGEFVCDEIVPIRVEYSDPNHRLALRDVPFLCLTDKQIMDYLGNGKPGYGWHISDLKIYDEPREILEFYSPPEMYCEKELCGGCPHDQVMGLDGDYAYDCEWKRPIKRPPQSWCYVSDLEG